MQCIFSILCVTFGLFGSLLAKHLEPSAVEENINALKDSNDSVKLELKKKWEEVLRNLKLAEGYRAAVKAHGDELIALKKQKDTPYKVNNLDSYSKLPEKYSYEDLVSTVEIIEGMLASANDKKRSISKQVAADEARILQIPKELGAVKARLSLLASENAQSKELVNIELQYSERIAIEASIAQLESENKLLDVRIPNNKESLASIDQVVADVQQVLSLWSTALGTENRTRAEAAKSKAEKLMIQLAGHPQLKSIAELNLRLVNQILASDNVPSQLKTAEVKYEKLKATLKSLDEQQTYAKKRLSLLDKAKIPIDRETGELLRKQRVNLLSDRELKVELKTLFQRSTRNEVAILELNKERELLPQNVDVFVNSLSLKEGDGLPTKVNAKELITSCDKLYLTLLKQREDLSVRQVATVDLLEKLIVGSKNYTNFIDSRLLWIVSHPVLDVDTLKGETAALQKLFGSSSLYQWYSRLKDDWGNWYPLWISVIVVVVALIGFRSRFKKRLPDEHEKASKRFCVTIKPTIIALMLEVALQLPVPLLIGFIGWRSPMSSALGGACVSSAVFLFVALLLRSFTKKKGFASSHFDLREKKRKIIHKVLNFIIPIMLPLLFLTQGMLGMNEGEGRILTILNLILMGYTMHLLLWPKKLLLAKQSAGMICYASYLLFCVFPFVLAIVAAVGYFVSVLTLRTQVIYSIRLVLLVMLLSALITRWLLISRRRIASKTASDSELVEVDQTPEAKLAHKQELHDKIEQVTQVTEQTSKFVKVIVVSVLFFGLTSIWANTLPALNILDQQELWQTTSSTPVEPPTNLLLAPGADTPKVDTSGASIVSVSLQDLLISFIILIITYIASTNIPGLLRMTILDRINLKAGAAFGVTTVVRYIIVIIGIVWAFNNIAVTWDKVQWIAAAVTLGIAFGLQEIFANFVAGLILLFERPVRIGDLVTIGGVNGKVSNIKIRATTILQFNNRELIVPNKEFITGQLVNWTLSDNIMRAEVLVGIAYGSDTELAKSLLLECANNNSRILETPPPAVVFSAFGASSLDFLCRVYVKSVDDLVPAQSELHFAIDKAFREGNIEIAFPQQDIHIRSIDAALQVQRMDQSGNIIYK